MKGEEGRMTPKELNKLLRTESESVEWKRSLGEWKDLVVSMAAMASLDPARSVSTLSRRAELWRRSLQGHVGGSR